MTASLEHVGPSTSAGAGPQVDVKGKGCFRCKSTDHMVQSCPEKPTFKPAPRDNRGSAWSAKVNKAGQANTGATGNDTGVGVAQDLGQTVVKGMDAAVTLTRSSCSQLAPLAEGVSITRNTGDGSTAACDLTDGLNTATSLNFTAIDDTGLTTDVEANASPIASSAIRTASLVVYLTVCLTVCVRLNVIHFLHTKAKHACKKSSWRSSSILAGV
jgi:hypothetical protein